MVVIDAIDDVYKAIFVKNCPTIPQMIRVAGRRQAKIDGGTDKLSNSAS